MIQMVTGRGFLRDGIQLVNTFLYITLSLKESVFEI